MEAVLRHLENVKAQLKAEEEMHVAQAKERVLRDIQPKYTEIEQIKAEELNSLQKDYVINRNAIIEQHNVQLAMLQQNFDKKNKEIVELAQNRKEELYQTTLQEETRLVVKKFEDAIIDIDELIAERTEKE